MSIGISAISFTPAEVEKITGVTTARQRDLRRHGFLPQVKGHARFNAYDLAELFFIQKMSERGVGPKQAFEVSEICATGIIWHALDNASAYKGDHLRLIENGILPDVVWDEDQEELVESMAQAAQEHGRTPEQIRNAINLENLREVVQSQHLKEQVTKLFRGRIIPAPFFIWWADNSETWALNLQSAFDDVSEVDPKRMGPVIVLSLESIGRKIIEVSNQPLFEVRIG